MREPDRPVDHLLKAVEELVRAGLALTGRKQRPDLIGELAAAFETEAKRWEQRARHDPAAKRVHDLMWALHDVLQPDDAPPPSARPGPGRPTPKRRAPRRGSSDVH